METTSISFETTKQFSSLFLSYINQISELDSFYDSFPSHERLIASSNAYSKVNREVLVTQLETQYAEIETSDFVRSNIQSLRGDNTFTITTGHQLNLATGPLFFIFKILTTIQLAEELKEKEPNKHFVPVFWMASEDHDFDEINHFHLFGKQYTWETNQTGAVGRFNTTGIKEVINNLPEAIPILEEAYSKKSLSEATRYLVNELFQEYGLVILDPDNKELKECFSPIMEQELIEQPSEEIIKKTSSRLESLGHKAQVHPRPINLFYLSKEGRNRIVVENDHYKVLNTPITFSSSEIINELKSRPDNFSPNVILRPVYQQKILPNLSYIGGPGELAYWFQLKGVFDHYQIDFPALVARNFGMIIPPTIRKKMDKFKLSNEMIFESFHSLKSKHMLSEGQDINLEEEIHNFQIAFSKIAIKGTNIDPSLKAAMEAEWQRLEKQLNGIEKRFKKAEERKHETSLKQLESIKEKLFPNGGLQERHDNIFNYLLNHPSLIKELKENMKGLNFTFSLFDL